MAENSPSLSLQRFAALAEAYGSDLARWPEAERDGAAPLAETEAGRVILDRARRLDRLLATYRVPEPSSALAGRVLADAGRVARTRRLVRRWWTGLGLAGVGLAGAIAAATAATAILPASEADWGIVADTGSWVNGDDIDLDAGRDPR